MPFNKQLQKRIENDNTEMTIAFSNLVSIIKNSKHKQLSKEKNDNVNDAVNEILSYFGIEAPDLPEEIENWNDRLEYILHYSGIMRRRIELKGKWWKDTTGAILGSTKTGDIISILPAFPSKYTFYDDDVKKWVKVNRESAQKLESDAFCFYSTLPAKKLNIIDLGLFMLRSISVFDIVLVFCASLLVSLLGLFIPFMNKQIFDSVIPSGIKGDILPVAVLLAGVAVGKSLFDITKSLTLQKLGDKINFSVQSAAMARIFSMPVTFFRDFSSGELSSCFMSIEQLSNILSDSVITTVLSLLFSVVYIIQMTSFAPSLVVPALIIIICMFGFTVLTCILQQKLSAKQIKLSAKLNGLVFGFFNGVQKIKLAGAEKRAFSKWASEYKENGRITYSPPLFIKINNAILGAITLTGSLIIYYSAAVNKISQSNYIAFNTSYGLVSGTLMMLSGIVLSIAQIKPLMKMIKPIFDSVPEIDRSKKIITSLSGNIEISNVTFRYTDGSPTILDNISLKINPGEYVAIVGRSGCGKSTLMRLMLGFDTPESGSLYYDGYDLKTLDMSSVRKNIGVVLQNGKLFSGDIFSNIIVTAPWSTLKDAWRAVSMAGLDKDIKAMPMGMNTIISEGSGGISGGQKQRILIARALVSNPKILFFDEATSALDNITQNHVADSLAELGCTRIVIAHRLSTVRNCDRIIVIDNGKIAEDGNYEQLMRKKGLFYEFAKRQIS